MILAELARRVRFFLFRDRVSRELEEEMRLHQDLRALREREAGRGEALARERARKQFGRSAHFVEVSRDQWGMRWADELSVDLRYGLRALRRTPVQSAVIVLTLAVGIGATLAMFTVMDAALFRPLPVREPERLVLMPNRDVPLEGSGGRSSGVSLSSLRQTKSIYEDVGTYAAGGLNLTGGVELIGTLTRYNRKSVTVITESGERWNVAPSALHRVEAGSPARQVPLRTV